MEPVLSKWLYLAALSFALPAYGLDCLGINMPEQEMECCGTMHCHSRGHRHHHQSHDCCNTSPQMHPTLGQPASAQAVPFAPQFFGLEKSSRKPAREEFSAPVIGQHAHDPPLSTAATSTVLRV